MTEFVNPSGYVGGTTGDDSYVFTAPLASSQQLGDLIVADALGGNDSLLFDVDYAQGPGLGLSYRATDFSGSFLGQVLVPYGPTLNFSEFENVRFVGTAYNDNFELSIGSSIATLSADFDAGAGNDKLVFDFSAVSAGQSFVVANGSITSTFGEFAGFESFEIRAGSGSDLIRTGDGNDYVLASSDLSPGSNADVVSTGGGDDRIHAPTPGTYDGGAGYDIWDGSAGGSTPITANLGSTIQISNGTTVTNVESVQLGTGAGDDIFNVTRDGPMTLYSGDGFDKLNVAMNLAQAQTVLVNTTTMGTLLGSVNELGFSEFEQLSFTGGAYNDSFRVIGIFTASQITFNGGGGSDTLQGEFNLLGGASQFVVNPNGTIVNNRGSFASFEQFFLAGGSADDLFVTAGGADILGGGGGKDSLDGGAGVDSLLGDDGDDTLVGGLGADYLFGGTGDDRLYVDNALDSVIEYAGQGAADRVLASTSWTLTAGSEVERVTTSNNAGTAAINLTGNELANVIYGNAGANVLDGKAGADTLVGLGGDDLYYVDNVGDVVSEAAGGGALDRIFASASYTMGAGVHVERLMTVNNAGTAAINLAGNELGNIVYGNAGANVLNGRAGNDLLVGLAGNDTLIGGLGSDTMNGGLGDDLYYVDAAGDAVFEVAGEGSDRVLASMSYALGASASIELLTTSNNAGTGAIDLTGNAIANTIYGNAGANVLDGKGGADVLVGLGGADSFAFTTALGTGNVDTVSGFSVADDTIVLENAVFAGLAAGALAAGAFATGPSATQADDRVVYNAATGALSFDADGNGAGAAIQFATLAGGLALTSADFLVV
jgi:serralysin